MIGDSMLRIKNWCFISWEHYMGKRQPTYSSKKGLK